VVLKTENLLNNWRTIGVWRLNLSRYFWNVFAMFTITTGIRDVAVGAVISLRCEQPRIRGVISAMRKRSLPWSVWRRTQPSSIQWEQAAFATGLKQSVLEAEHSPASSSEVNSFSHFPFAGTALSFRYQFFQCVTLRQRSLGARRSEIAYRADLQVSWGLHASQWPLKMRPLCGGEMAGTKYPATQRHIPELIPHPYLCDKDKIRRWL
jgi:hypothetical protein